ncbi:MAG TPA: hypothetical protein VKR58_07035 [Aquella sp.]|nr:hypothetical protein [Aquella sp.]
MSAFKFYCGWILKNFVISDNLSIPNDIIRLIINFVTTHESLSRLSINACFRRIARAVVKHDSDGYDNFHIENFHIINRLSEIKEFWNGTKKNRRRKIYKLLHRMRGEIETDCFGTQYITLNHENIHDGNQKCVFRIHPMCDCGCEYMIYLNKPTSGTSS